MTEEAGSTNILGHNVSCVGYVGVNFHIFIQYNLRILYFFVLSTIARFEMTKFVKLIEFLKQLEKT